jgi:hypothetical protein
MRDAKARRQNWKYLEPWVVAAADAAWMATLDDVKRAMVEIMAAKEVRGDQLIAALDHWNEARLVAKDRSGEAAADDRLALLCNERADVYGQVATTRARTLSGVLAKLALIAPDFDDESASELSGEMGTSPEVLFSIAVDFKELKAGQALSAENASV